MGKTRPVIGIATSMNDAKSRIILNHSYFKAIWGAGGLPVGLPFALGAEDAEKFFASGEFDGFLFAGGCDVHPSEYGEEITADNVECVEERDSFELALARLLLPTDIPVLGICRGVQTLNVAFGGTLVQDIPGHRQEEPGKERPEPVDIVKGSFLYGLIGSEKGCVNSFHHQCVKDVAPGFVASAYSTSDGIIEAIEPATRTERFLLGVQWHPELFYNVDASSNAIFDAFVNACRKS